MITDSPGEIEKDIFEDLYKSSLKVFEDFAFFILGNTEQAEDVVADCFIRLWNERSRVTREKAIGWMYTSIRNASLNLLKKSSTRKEVNESSSDNEVFAATYYQAALEKTDLAGLYVEDITNRLKDCLSHVPENQRRAFLMNRLDNMTYKEIAAKLNITESVVDHSIRNVTKLLSIYMKDYLLFTFILLFLKAHS